MKNRFRWKPALWILLAVGLVQIAAWLVLEAKGERTFQTVSLYLGAIAAFVLLLVWWVFLSGLGRKAKLAGLGAAILALLAMYQILRFEGSTGRMHLELGFVWEPTPLELSERLNQESDPGELEEALLTLQEGDWPQYLGPRRDGSVDVEPFPRNFAPLEPLWKREVGLGWGSFAIVGNRAFTLEQRGEYESVVCYESRTGRQIWVHQDQALFSEAMGGEGPRTTPTFHQGRLYTLGATGILNCLDPRDGSLHWSRDILEDAGADNLAWGMAGSPLIHGGMVVVSPGGRAGASLAAYHKDTGEPLWKGGSAQASYSSPSVHSIRGQEQILIHNGPGLYSHRPSDGSVLWSYEYTNMPQIHAALPFVLEEAGSVRILLSTGYSTGATLLELPEEGPPAPLWKNRSLKPKFSTLILHEGYVYGADEGILACIRLEDGKRMWKDGRHGYGQLLRAGDVLLVQAEAGHVALVEATPEEYRELSRFPALEGKTWNHPALTSSLLLLRNGKEACAFSLPGPAGAEAL